MKKAENK